MKFCAADLHEIWMLLASGQNDKGPNIALSIVKSDESWS